MSCFEVTKMLIAVLKHMFIVSFIIVFGGKLSFPRQTDRPRQTYYYYYYY